MLGTFLTPIDLREEQSDVRVSPNPFSDSFSVMLEIAEPQTAVVVIYSITGQLVYQRDFKVTPGTNTLNLQPQISNGIYLMHVITDQDFVIHKLIKN